MAENMNNNMHHDESKQNITIKLQFNLTVGLFCGDKNQLNISQHFESTVNLQFCLTSNPQKYSFKRSVTLASICHHIELQNQDRSL